MFLRPDELISNSEPKKKSTLCTVAYLLLLFGWDCGCWYPTAHNDTNMNDETTNDWKFPLLLSCLAGASTCVGAAIVFVLSLIHI